MEIELLHSTLDKGEKWANKGKRTIKICPSSDFSQSVYFSIWNKGSIVQDFFLSPEDAERVGKILINTAKAVKNRNKRKGLKGEKEKFWKNAD